MSDIQEKLQREALRAQIKGSEALISMIGDLTKMIQENNARAQRPIFENVQKIELKGDKGDSPIFGVDFLKKDEMDAIKKEILDDATPVYGSDYMTPEQCKAWKDDITDDLKAHFPIPENGKSFTWNDLTQAQKLELTGQTGAIGPMPKHQWQGTSLRFEHAPGIWGNWHDLKGDPGTAGKDHTPKAGDSFQPRQWGGARVLGDLDDFPRPTAADIGKVLGVNANNSGFAWVSAGGSLTPYWKKDGSSGAATGDWNLGNKVLYNIHDLNLVDVADGTLNGNVTLNDGSYFFKNTAGDYATLRGNGLYIGDTAQTFGPTGSGGYLYYNHIQGGYDQFTLAIFDPTDEWGIGGGIYLGGNGEEGYGYRDGSGTGFTASSGNAGLYLGGSTIIRGDAGGLYIGSGLDLAVDIDCTYIYSNGYHRFQDGAVASPSLAFTSATNYGLWYNASHVNFSAAGALTMRYSTAGLGIGSTFPISAKLHIASTTEQIRSGYSSSIYWNAITNSVGLTTFTSTGGSTPKFAFASSVTLRAGSTAADTFPLLFQSGSLATTPVAGMQEFLTDKYYATITTGAARKEISLNDIALTSGRVPFTTTNGRLTDNANLAYTSGTGLLIADNLKLTAAGNGLYVKEGTNATMGTATLVGGTVVVNTTKVTANSRIFLTTNGGTLTNVGAPYVSARTAATSFTITSTNVLDTSAVAWIIIEPA